jgi:DNA (cytosine-5)-methyltransferase 1
MTRADLEFFAGAGMARLGLGPGWTCLFANDFDPRKATSYIANFGAEHFRGGDIAQIELHHLPPERVDLAWASPPCVDLSEAGKGAGLKGERSGAVWPFLRLMKELRADGRAPRTIVIENVTGWLERENLILDFIEVVRALATMSYKVGAIVVDAASFVPQSRERVFIIAVDSSIPIPVSCTLPFADLGWPSKALAKIHARLPPVLKPRWVWWRLPTPPARTTTLADVLLDDPCAEYLGEFPASEVARHLDMIANKGILARIMQAEERGPPFVGPFARRMRDVPGQEDREQRVEVRDDGLANALRVMRGGSSKQFIVISAGTTRMRAIQPREAARLMGIPDSYILPRNPLDALSLAGDGVAVPVVRHIAEHILEPVLDAAARPQRAAWTPRIVTAGE